MTSMRTLGLVAVLTASVASSAFAATGTTTTTTPTSPAMSAPNTLSHDGTNQLGATGPTTGSQVSGGAPAARDSRADNRNDATTPRTAGCGGVC